MSIYIFDTEFQESGNKHPIVPISIGIVKLDADSIQKDKISAKTYYAVSSEFEEDQLSDWLKENVVPHLDKEPHERKSLSQIKKEILDFVGDDENPKFMADFASYDWVVFCQIFGTMTDLPERFPMFCIDLQQLLLSFGNPKMPEQTGTNHNALDDAIHSTKCFLNLYNQIKDQDFTGSHLISKMLL